MDSTRTPEVIARTITVEVGRAKIAVEITAEAGMASATLTDKRGHTEHVTMMPTSPVTAHVGSGTVFGSAAWSGSTNGKTWTRSKGGDMMPVILPIRDRDIRRALIQAMGRLELAALATLPVVDVVSGVTDRALLGVDALPATMTGAEALETHEAIFAATKALAARRPLAVA